MRIGRCEVKFGWYCWIQTYVPTQTWHFLCFWIFREARPEDVDKKKRFPLGTKMAYHGRAYRYYEAGRQLDKGESVVEDSL